MATRSIRQARIDITRLAALSVVFAVVAGGGASGFPAFEPLEAEAALFDNGSYRHVNSKVDVTGTSVDVRRTISKWASGLAEAASDGVEVLGSLASFTSTAYALAGPTSVRDEQGGTVACSTGEGDIACSAGSGTDGPVGCSTGTEETTQVCSTADPEQQGGYASGCSTSAGGGANEGTATCSAYVDSADDVEGADNTTCSAWGDEGTIAGVTRCSAGGTTGAVGCSTAGGQSGAFPSGADGTVACSADGRGGEDGVSCSAAAGEQTVTCSTFTGERQVCSAGRAGTGRNASCSATGTDTPDSTTTCSVTDAPPQGAHPNMCSASAFPVATPGNSRCSSDQASGGNGQCSVFGSAAGENTNAQCSALPTATGPAPAQYYCSADLSNAGGAVTNETCSVFDENGEFVEGPTNGICGDDELEPPSSL